MSLMQQFDPAPKPCPLLERSCPEGRNPRGIPVPGPVPDLGPDAGLDSSLLHFLAIVRARRCFLACAALLPALAMLLACLLLIPPTYLSKAALLPSESYREPDLLAPALAEKLPLGLDLLERKEDKIVMAFLRSRTLTERLLASHGLLERLYDTPWDRLRARLGLLDSPTASLAIQEGKPARVFRVQRKPGDAVIALTWKDRDPDYAALMLSQAIAELRHFLEREHVSEATRQRRFIEAQTSLAAAELAAWEARTPEASLSLPRLQREIAAATALHAELVPRLAMARIAEAREIVSFKVLDEPFRPVKKHWPRTTWLTLTAMALGLLAGLFLVFVRRTLVMARQVHVLEPDR